METEIWKPVVGAEGKYEVSNMGRVRGLSSRWGPIDPHILSQYINRDGYKLVQLWINNRSRANKVHRLVASAFIPNPGNKPCIDHIDGDPANNNIENLRWCTMKENMNNPISISRHSKSGVKPTTDAWKQGRFDMMKRRVVQMTIEGIIIKIWDSAAEAARSIGLCRQTIYGCCWGKKKSCGGFRWAYIDFGNRKMANNKFVLKEGIHVKLVEE